MIRSRWVFIFCSWLLQFQIASGQSTDSLWISDVSTQKKFKSDGFLATSFFVNNNWKATDYTSVTLACALNLNYRKNSSGLKRIHELRSEIGYQKIIDSVWIKNTDNLYISNNWILGGRTSFRNSFSISLKTQIADTWDRNQSVNQSGKWKSGPMLPATLITGYGINWMFWKKSFLNFSFAALKIVSFPRKEHESENIRIVAKTGRANISSEYGFNLQSSIAKMIAKNIKWENKTSFFATGLEKEIMNFDMQNIISLFPARFIKIRFDLRTGYDFMISSKMQWRYEMLVGYFFER